MELNQLHYFLEVAQREHMTQAAGFLHISQPALSKTIARLEGDLGTSLFDREGKSVRLNEYGRVVRERAERIFIEIEDMLRSIRDLEEGKRGQVTVGCSLPTREMDWITNSLFAFCRDYPNVSLAHIQMRPSQLLEEMQKGEADIGLGGSALRSEEVDWAELFSEKLGVIMSRDHPLASKGEVSLAELAGERFISNNANSDIFEMTNELCRRAGFTPNTFIQSYDAPLLGRLIGHGMGVSVIAEKQYYRQAAVSRVPWEHNIVYCRLREDYCVRRCGIAINKKRYLSSAARALYSYIIKQYPQDGGAPDPGIR